MNDDALYLVGTLPDESARPKIPPDDDIVLYIHGGPGSRLEECSDLVGPLHVAGLKRGKRFTIISFDQPSQGYSTMLGPDQIVPEHQPFQDYYPAVQFSEDFIVAFVDALHEITPIKNRNIYIIGGSTGGALTLRMGHRREDWIKRIVAWSPASVWTTYANDEPKGFALNSGFARSTPGEDDNQRKDYFNEVFGAPSWWPYKVQPNPEEWYRGDRGSYPGNKPPGDGIPFASEWPCKWDYIAAARLEQHEIYNWRYRRWHWRLGTEMLLFSFHNDDWLGPANTASDGARPIYLDIHKPTLLCAAQDDDWNEGEFTAWENRWTRTREMAALMTETPGRTLYLTNTGHSIHNERPRLFAEAIADFLCAATMDTPLSSTSSPVPNVPDEDANCRGQLAQLPRIPPELLADSAAAAYLMEPAHLGGKFSDGRNAGEHNLRLNPKLRALAAQPALVPAVTLGRAAAAIYQGDTTFGNACADLAITGRNAYQQFQNQPQTQETILPEARKALPANTVVDEGKLQDAVYLALTRAYQVAWALRNPDRKKAYDLRQTLGWITASGEDDSPARPVNVPSGVPIFGPDGTQISSFPQYELAVAFLPAIYDGDPKELLPAKACPVGTADSVTFYVRYTIASPPA